LVVVDDIWDEDAWTTLKAALFDNNCDSNIIVTTRKDEVATAACCSSNRNHVYRMQPLGSKDSELLFLKRTFHGKECPPDLKGVCDEILKKCGGSPLAIVVLSGMLTSKVTASQWRNVLKTISSGDSKYNVVRRIISLSYFDLPLHLRTCLMYLSIFPEDFKISRKRLVNRWIAEGFVSCIDGISITETAERYFGDLISRNLIQAVDIKYDGEARACRVHDTILDFIIYKGCEENFVSINGPRFRSGNKVRRLSIQNYQDAKERLAVAAEDLSHIRSITLFGYSEHMTCPLSLRGYANLRVVDAKDAFSYDEGAESPIDFDVASLPHLKYLDLSGLHMCELQEEFYTHRVLTAIGNLQYLETLDLRGTEVLDLPTDLYKLRRLVRLFISQYTRLPDGIGQLKALEELKWVWISEWSSLEFLQELGELTKMGSMHIGISDVDISDEQELVLVSSLEKLSNLRSLRIHLDDMPGVKYGISWRAALQGLRKLRISEHDGVQTTAMVPDWMGKLNGLEKLVLRVEEIEQNDLDILGELQSLLYLKLFSSNKRGLFMDNKGFQSLKYLDFFCGYVTFRDGSVPRLQQLDLSVTTINIE
jgi:Leucine-rich repeat (LRR) protein